MNAKPIALRLAVTLLLVSIAAVIAWQLWIYYMDDPWTRDGRVRADVVEVAPDVSGLVAQVFVHDDQVVHAGDALFAIDPARFTLAIAQADAAVTKAKASYDNARSDAQRYAALSGSAVSALTRDQSSSASAEAGADYAQAQADAAVAQLNLARTTVRATVNGTVSNFSMRPGDYVSAGQAVAAIVDADSLYVDGYFEETKLQGIRLGDPARITLLGGGGVITGHVESIAAGIADQERAQSPNLLADVNPTFTWVRLAQRVPVRIALDHVPAGIYLIAGLTATVAVEPRGGRGEHEQNETK